MAKVSVILPSLNVASYIRQCMDSVATQTMRDIEILCVDAGSNDGTLEIIEEYALRDKRVRLIHSPQRSYGYQMNLGIREATGEYIGIVETDDFVECDMFEGLYTDAVRYDLDVVKGMLVELYEYGEGRTWARKVSYIPEAAPFKTGEPFSPDEFPEVHQWDGNIWNGIYRRSFLLDNGIFFNETPGAAYQDIGFRHLTANFASSMMFTERNYYHYRIVREGSSTWNNRCVRNIFQEYKKLFDDNRIKPKHRDAFYARMFPAYLYEYDKALRYSDYDISRLECPEGIDWLYDLTYPLLRKQSFAFGNMSDWNRRQLLKFINRTEYIRWRKELYQALDDFMSKYVERARDKGYILFGAGNYGRFLLLFHLRNGLFPAAIADNDEALWGEKIEGIPVISPLEATDRYPEAAYLIANKRRGDEIATQLQSLGVSKEQLVFYDGTDDLLRVAIGEMTILF